MAQFPYRRIVATLSCALVYGPLILVLNIGKLALEGDLGFADFNRSLVSEVLVGVVKIGAASLPVMLVSSLIMHMLAWLGRDSLAVSVFMGAAIGYLGVAVFTLAFLGEVPGHRELSDAVLSFASGAVLGAFYWAICIRKERALRKAREIEQAAVRAME